MRRFVRNQGFFKARTFISVSEQKGNLGIGLVRRVEDKNCDQKVTVDHKKI